MPESVRKIIILLLCGAVLLVGCRRRESAVIPPRPERNVILISIDSLRADHLGCYGYQTPSGVNTTPALDRFAQQGSRFLYAYATSPWTLPSHASMFTGLYADTHSVNLPQSIINEKKDTLATVLQRNGYDTGAIVCAPLLSKRFGLQQGFGDYDTDLIGMTPRLASEAKVGPDVTRKALNWLDRHLDRPFFLFLHYWDVHYDYNPPDKYAALFDPDYQGEMNGMYIHERRDVVPGTPPRDLQHLVALYDAEIRYTDDAIGQLLAGLAERGLDQNTAVIITSDHGDEFLEHGALGHTKTCYEELIRIPLLLRVPWLPKQSPEIDEMASLVDLLPTILDLLEIDPYGLTMQGRSLLPVIPDNKAFAASRFFFAEAMQGKFPNQPEIFRWSTMITQKHLKMHRWQLQKKHATWLLFDLNANPAETVPIGEDKPVVHRKLLMTMKKEMSEHRDLRGQIQMGAERELDPKTEENLRGLGYLQ